jgi:hypothetical protein
MGDILDLEHGGLAGEYEAQMHGGNALWAQPEKARAAGAAILHQLVEHHRVTPEHDDSVSGVPEMPEQLPQMFADLLEAVGYAGLPTARRVHIISGFVEAAAESGVLGGRAEWASAET